ncbi:hypothetical protein QUV83_10915 [Cellulomonas cellasea]|uniref:hypothetical protein n=1 Tax=Cellulomonas cellasea TaxID=43670 RepID=UPI0025A38ECE|nr:hypothetical protein [Cellulomonas cellasea]MDM8085276.1 hypothetical protein [Cellulomonas cellasea]
MVGAALSLVALAAVWFLSPGDDLVISQRAGLPAGVSADPGHSGAVVRGEERLVDVYIGGSSSCPTELDRAEFADGVLTVHFTSPRASGPCTADLAYTTTTIALPPEAPSSDELDVRIVIDD